MSANLYDTANQLEREIREDAAFQALSASFKRLKENEEAYGLFKEFQTFQQELHQKMMSGEELSDDDAQQAQALAEKVQTEEIINDLMKHEQAFSLVVNDLNRIIMNPLRELYEGEKKERLVKGDCFAPVISGRRARALLLFLRYFISSRASAN